jgi:hypothetical protein
MQMNQVNVIIIQWINALWKHFSHHIHASHHCVSIYAVLLEPRDVTVATACTLSSKKYEPVTQSHFDQNTAFQESIFGH